MIEDKNYIYDARHRTVVKANELIQKSRFNLSLQEQKIVLYLISKISPLDSKFYLYDFSIIDFCRICGIDYTSGKNYEDIKKAIKDIADKSIYITLPNGTETLVRWIEKPYIDRRSGRIKIRLDEDMKPYLLQLQRNFTQYELVWTLRFKCKYSTRLYELVKSIHYHELETYSREYSLDEIRQLLGAENYTTYQTLKSRVLLPAVNEINRYSDKELDFEPIKVGRAVDRIRFTIATKDTLSCLRLQIEAEKEFGLNQLSLFGD